MTRKRLLAGALVMLVLGSAGALALFGIGVLAPATDYLPVRPGHQEIVFLAPATSGEAWERLVAAVDALHEEALKPGADKPHLNVFKRQAFTDLTADVPEVAIWPDGGEDAKLWIRWYKLSAGHNSDTWVSRLTERSTPPLAVVGGDTSHRALRIAEALERHRQRWQGAAPLFFITTATADRYVPNNAPTVFSAEMKWPKLLDVYQGRTFRFSFSNSRMAAAVLDFARTHDDLWPEVSPDPAKTYLYTVGWDDDNFSADLAERFWYVFQEKFPKGRVSDYHIEYSVGDFFQPNPREAFVAGQLVPELFDTRERRRLLLLPADADRARRFLRTIVRRLEPQDYKNLIVMTGDSLGFNTIFRDRSVAWNIQDLPVQLLTFCHRNPVAEDVGFTEGNVPGGGTGTEDLLLYRDILETLLLTAYQGPRLTASSEELNQGLGKLSWAGGRVQKLPAGQKGTVLFNMDNGNRHNGTGEHIVVLQPDPEDRARATITVWQLGRDADQPDEWSEMRTLSISYNAVPQ